MEREGKVIGKGICGGERVGPVAGKENTDEKSKKEKSIIHSHVRML